MAVNKLFSKYKVEIEVMKPRVPYRETIRKSQAYVVNIRSSQADTDNMVMLPWNSSHPAIWRLYVFEERYLRCT